MKDPIISARGSAFGANRSAIFLLATLEFSETELVGLFWQKATEHPGVQQVNHYWEVRHDQSNWEIRTSNTNEIEYVFIFLQVPKSLTKGKIADDIQGEELHLLGKVYWVVLFLC
ncbi:hypothetical protein HG530_006950 [Fusarium avenaceum]|nr:hypothetical protein HG530_006950 [Fusarium avenaceum]